MHKQISSTLQQIEIDEKCQILYACESGSRAWGFPSPDSDYDLRFIYRKPLEWYLRLEPTSDTIEHMAPNDLDLSGWELGKALRLFAGCNLALNEWLDSPEVYFENQSFVSDFRLLIPEYFNPRKAVFHYYSMASKTIEQNMNGTQIKIKKVFYVLRPVLACIWVISRGSMPPTQFEKLLLEQNLPSDLIASVQELLRQKLSANESDVIDLHPTIGTWLYKELETISIKAKDIRKVANPGWESVNNLMLKWVSV